MTTDLHDPAAIEQTLWKTIEHVKTGMLGGSDPAVLKFQPMTAFCDAKQRQIWFFSRHDTDFAKELGRGSDGIFIFQNADVQAVVHGTLTPSADRARIEQYWNPVLSAWYPQGKDDPLILTICFDCNHTQVWVSDAGPIKFVWEIARANVTKTPPQLGAEATLDLRHGAAVL